MKLLPTGSSSVAIALGVVALAVGPPRASGQSMPAPLVQFLQHAAALTSDEIGSATNGNTVVKLLPSDQREVALIGVVRIDVPRSFYVSRAIDFPTSLRELSTVSFGIFSDPTAASDVAAFKLKHDEARDLAKCRLGSCMLKLPGPAMAHLSATIDPDSPSADSVASAYFREHMLSYVTSYRDRGNQALVVYNDRPDSDAAAQVLDEMLSRSPYMYEYAPSLERYLKNYPHDRPADVHEAIFWSNDTYPRLSPMLTIAHQIVYAPPELPHSTLIVSKQLYCDHYLDGGLDLTAVVDQAGGGGGPTDAVSTGIYMVYLRRLHFDYMPSGGLIDIRGTVISQVKGRATNFLRDAKTSSEKAYTTQRAKSP
jgi:hypothetical protein